MVVYEEANPVHTLAIPRINYRDLTSFHFAPANFLRDISESTRRHYGRFCWYSGRSAPRFLSYFGGSQASTPDWVVEKREASRKRRKPFFSSSFACWVRASQFHNTFTSRYMLTCCSLA